MIRINKEELYWLAGLLEGEGCFHWSKNKAIAMSRKVSYREAEIILSSLLSGKAGVQ